MKLGTETGSIINHIQSRSVIGEPVPEVGMGATLLCWTDRHAATVIRAIPPIITVQQDTARRIDSNGQSESQTYEFTPNPEGVINHFRRDKNGIWQEVRKNSVTGRWVNAKGLGLRLGARDEYYDFSF